MLTMELALDQIILDPNLQMRDKIPERVIQRYADSWSDLPMMTVYNVDGTHRLVDGFIRYQAALRLGLQRVSVIVRQGSIVDAMEYAARVNIARGYTLSVKERRRAVRVAILMRPEWSDRRHADILGVSRELVAKTRGHLERDHLIASGSPRLGCDGKVNYTISRIPETNPLTERLA